MELYGFRNKKVTTCRNEDGSNFDQAYNTRTPTQSKIGLTE